MPNSSQSPLLHTLNNGLKVTVLSDPNSPLATLNIMYDVGARDENPERTGFAHLFEHLMFEGSMHIPHFDRVLQEAGGTNNAYTTNDITNYYCTLPATNLTTALWLESDRLCSLDFSEEKLGIQKKVVIEEFKQRYLNQPYGDVWMLLRSLCFKRHPYQWATIGKDTEPIEQASLEEVKHFFYSYYAPNNAYLSVVGGVDEEQTLKEIDYWFGGIPRRDVPVRNLPKELPQQEARNLLVERNVPNPLVYLAWPMPEKLHPDYIALDLLSDILGSGRSCLGRSQLIESGGFLTSFSASVLGSRDPGLFLCGGIPGEKYTTHTAEEHILSLLNQLPQLLSKERVEKVKTRAIAREYFDRNDQGAMAAKLSFAAMEGSLDYLYGMEEQYQKITPDDLIRVSQTYLVPSAQNTLHYQTQP
jgi:zinc protease